MPALEPTLYPDHVVPFDGAFSLSDFSTVPPGDSARGKALKKELKALVAQLHDLQRKLYADGRHSVLTVFQAMDAAGKDGTIRKVFSGVNPTGFRTSAFEAPSGRERKHDFLWRCQRALPMRGKIGIFNRSHYEEVLVVRVKPELLAAQKLPNIDPATIWNERLESIRDWERHLARNGVVVVKFWLNLSHDEQRRRLLARIDRPEKNWKFDAADLDERLLWDDYMHAYAEALAATSRPHAPWYAIPADYKPYMRVAVARIMVHTLENLDMAYPEPSTEHLQLLEAGRERLLDQE
ncbi:MAG: polyphosphate kinase 2 family protein [Wenzhouxiangellaceae bacterium]|nr:polyphosphate kinase 2 family protein [Wenzhouxiangellaceae bacterium]